MARKRTPTWMEVAVAGAGMRTAVRAMTWAHQWAVAREALGHDPTVDEVAEWWKLNRRTAFREQAAFREAFPTLDTPAKLYESPEARAALRKLADFGDQLDEIGERRRARTQELGIARIAGLPSSL